MQTLSSVGLWGRIPPTIYSKQWPLGSCGTVGRGVASDARDLQFKSSHQQCLFSVNCTNKDDKKEKSTKMALL